MKTELLSIIRSEGRTAKLRVALRTESKIVSCQNTAGKDDSNVIPAWHNDELAFELQGDKALARGSQTFLLLQHTEKLLNCLRGKLHATFPGK